jgi:hypothetical protein
MALKKGNVVTQEVPATERPAFDLDEAGIPPEPAAAAQAEPVGAEPEVDVVLQGEGPIGTTAQMPVQLSGHASVPMTTGPGKGSAAMVVQSMADDGMDGLDLGFGAFPIITLGTDGEFSSNDLGNLDPKEFNCIVMRSTAKYICKNGLQDNDPKADFFYTTYHPNFAPNEPPLTGGGKPIEDILTEWKVQSWTPVWKKYVEVLVQIVGGDHDGAVAMLSVPPTSISRLGGYIALQKMQHGLRQDQYITRVSVGAKITTAAQPFRPWSFSYAGPREMAA